MDNVVVDQHGDFADAVPSFHGDSRGAIPFGQMAELLLGMHEVGLDVEIHHGPHNLLQKISNVQLLGVDGLVHN